MIIGFRVFTFVEYSLITIFFYTTIKSKLFKTIIKSISILFIAYSLYDMFNSNWKSFDSVPSGISAIILIAFCVFALFEKINTTENLFIYSDLSFWIIVALLFYFAGTFFIFLFATGNLNDTRYESTFKLMNNGFSILRNLILMLAFAYWRKRNPTQLD